MNLEDKKKTIKRIIDNLNERDTVQIYASASICDNLSEQNYDIRVVKNGKLRIMPKMTEVEEYDDWD
ncbi:MAG: hypothetical protein ABIC91_07670 [Nanoarchaeota archaeon]